MDRKALASSAGENAQLKNETFWIVANSHIYIYPGKTYSDSEVCSIENSFVLDIRKRSAGLAGSLWGLLDSSGCKTAFGRRLLRTWLARPLLDVRDIQARTDAVAELALDGDLADRLRSRLRHAPPEFPSRIPSLSLSRKIHGSNFSESPNGSLAKFQR